MLFKYKKVGYFVVLNEDIMSYFQNKTTANARKMEMISLGFKHVKIVKAYTKENKK